MKPWHHCSYNDVNCELHQMCNSESLKASSHTVCAEKFMMVEDEMWGIQNRIRFYWMNLEVSFTAPLSISPPPNLRKWCQLNFLWCACVEISLCALCRHPYGCHVSELCGDLFLSPAALPTLKSCVLLLTPPRYFLIHRAISSLMWVR